MTTAEVGARDDLLVERQIRDAVAGIEVHVTGLEGLLGKFCDEIYEYGEEGDGHDEDLPDEGDSCEDDGDDVPLDDDDDGGAGVAHLEVLSFVFDDLIEGRLQPGWEQHRIWSEKERDTWSPFATEMTTHVYAIPPLLLKVQELWTRTSKPHGFSNLANLSYRITSLFDHEEPDPAWVEGSRGVSRKDDEETYVAYTEPRDDDDDGDVATR